MLPCNPASSASSIRFASSTKNFVSLSRGFVATIMVALGALVMPSSATAQGVTADTILIGQSAALSGPAEALGKEMKAGAEAYFEAVNRRGGVNGRKIKLVSLDDGYEPDRAKANTEKLINEQKVLALFGYVGTPTSNAALPVFTKAGVPFVGAFTGAQSLREPFNRYIFNVRASYFDETEAIVRHLTTIGITRVAVFYQNDGYGQAGLAGVERALKARNLTLVAKATVERNSTDVAKAVATLSAAMPTAIIQISAYKSCAAFIKAMQQGGHLAQYWNVSFVGSKALSNELGESGRGVQISQVMPFPWSDAVPIVAEYQKAMGSEDKFSFTSLEGYVAAAVLVEGIRRSGKNLTREKLVETMSNFGHANIGGFRVHYSPGNHNGSSFVELTMLSKEGKFIR